MRPESGGPGFGQADMLISSTRTHAMLRLMNALTTVPPPHAIPSYRSQHER
jgi:hypothetical protein